MKKKIAICMAMLLMLSTVGCGSQTNEEPPSNSQTIQYSNLADEDSRSAVGDLLENNGLPKQQVEAVLTWAKDYTELLPQSAALPEGFQSLPEAGADYSGIFPDDTGEAYAYLQWLNCRLTAFSLLKDQIKTARSGFDTDLWLMFDIEAIDTVPELALSAEQRADFITLFNHVSVEGTTTLQEHEERIQGAWKEREIQLSAGDAVSLICVYLHDPMDEARFVGHTGVLIEQEDSLLFVEKYSNLAPFQATYFHDRKELKQYLLSRTDLYGDGTELAPILTENGALFAD